MMPYTCNALFKPADKGLQKHYSVDITHSFHTQWLLAAIVVTAALGYTHYILTECCAKCLAQRTPERLIMRRFFQQSFLSSTMATVIYFFVTSNSSADPHKKPGKKLNIFT